MFESRPESAGEPDPGGAADDAGLGEEWLESARAAQAGVGQLSSLVDVDVAEVQQILEAEELTGTWRALLDAMLAGTMTIEHTRAIGRQLRHLPGYGSADEVEAAACVMSCVEVLKVVVPFAATHTPGECGKKAALLVTAADPAGARKRRRKAAERDHGVFVNPLEPGTSEIRAVMPTAYAEALHWAVKTLAKDDRFGGGGHRAGP